jgi:Holliday junction resolvasome RuvABC endonuclease subunit
VAIEDYAYSQAGASSSVTDMAEIAGAVKQMLWSRFGIVPFIIQASVARAFTCGSGSAKKADVIRVLKSDRYNRQLFKTDDEYDAMALTLPLYFLVNPAERGNLNMKQTFTIGKLQDRVLRETGIVVPPDPKKKVQAVAQ